jgi:hypothetical protein
MSCLMDAMHVWTGTLSSICGGFDASGLVAPTCAITQNYPPPHSRDTVPFCGLFYVNRVTLRLTDSGLTVSYGRGRFSV